MITNNNFGYGAKIAELVGAGIVYFASPMLGQSKQNNLERTLTNKEKVNLQRGLQAPGYKGEDPSKTHFIFKLPFSQDLERAIKNSEKPEVYLITKNGKSVKDSFIKFNQDSSSLELYYSKNGFNEGGESEVIGVGIKERGKKSVCDSTGLGSKVNYLPFSYIKLKKPTLLKEESPDTIKQTINNYYYIDLDIENKTINNSFYPENGKQSPEDTSNNGLHIEASKAINRENGLSIEGGWENELTSGEIGNLSGGFYIEGNLDHFERSNSRYEEKTELISQPADLYAKTFGNFIEKTNVSRPFGFGIEADLSSANKTFGLRSGFGLKYQIKKDSIISQGHDQILEGDKVIDSSPYCFGSELSNKKELVPSAKVEAYLAPFKNKLAQFEVGVQKTWGKVRNEGMRVYGGFRYKF